MGYVASRSKSNNRPTFINIAFVFKSVPPTVPEYQERTHCHCAVPPHQQAQATRQENTMYRLHVEIEGPLRSDAIPILHWSREAVGKLVQVVELASGYVGRSVNRCFDRSVNQTAFSTSALLC